MSVMDYESVIAHYPSWARELARKYFTKTLAQFILYGNVRDLIPTIDEAGNRTYLPLNTFLGAELFASRDIVIFYDRSGGIHFLDENSRRDFNRAVAGYDSLFGTHYQRALPRDPVRVFTLLENYFRTRLADGKRIACIIDYAETIVPATEDSLASAEDRDTRVFLLKWARDPLFLERDFTLCLITENLSSLNTQLVRSPYTADIQLPIPGEEERRQFIDWYLKGRLDAFMAHSEVTPEALASHTAGLNLVQLQMILADVLENGHRLTYEELVARKKEIIEAEAYGLLEFVETQYTLDMVAGHHATKNHLRQAAHALKQGQFDVIPMGYLVAGPVGTGKTFLITCFAGEIGIPMVKLKNFRSKWVGETESNLEKILTLLEAMNPVAVMIDEADAALGDRRMEGDSGLSSRVFSTMVAFMSEPEHRGRILWFLVTARPDLMPVDLKRQGRAEEHIALFYPSTRAEREELLQVMMQRMGIDLPLEKIPESLLNGERMLSGADIEALLTRARFRAAAISGDSSQVTPEILAEVVDDFIPPVYPLEIELQTLAAVLECTSRTMLPESYRSMEREALVRRLEALKELLGER